MDSDGTPPLYRVNLAIAALAATLLRASLVMVLRRRFPPIWPPLRPIFAIYCDNRSWGSAEVVRGVFASGFGASLGLWIDQQSTWQAGLDHADVYPCRSHIHHAIGEDAKARLWILKLTQYRFCSGIWMSMTLRNDLKMGLSLAAIRQNGSRFWIHYVRMGIAHASN